MGQLHDAVTSVRAHAVRAARGSGAVAAPLVLGLIASMAVAACGPQPGSGVLVASPAATSSPSGGSAPSGSAPGDATAPATAAAIAPDAMRLAWLTDADGRLGVWTTDLAGGDARVHLGPLDEDAVALREPLALGDDALVIRDGATSDLWRLPADGPPRVLLDRVDGIQPLTPDAVLAYRDIGAVRELWRVPLVGPSVQLGEILRAQDDGSLGGFSVAISPDGRTVAAGWVGGPVQVLGPFAATTAGIGRPLVVDDGGHVLATAGAAGELYRVVDATLEPLAPEDADPLAVPGTSIVAWSTADAEGGLLSVELRDVASGEARTYPASGAATNLVAVTAEHVRLEATAFDPLHRTTTVVRLADGAWTTFAATAPRAPGARLLPSTTTAARP